MKIAILNLKAYARRARVAQLINAAREAHVPGWKIYIAVPSAFIGLFAGADILAQHADAVELGAHTGAVLPAHLKDLGIAGSLLNHVEKPHPAVTKAVDMLHEEGLIAVVCTEGEIIEKADMIAYERRGFIGGEKSIASAAEDLRALRRRAKGTLLAGGGIKTHSDVETLLKLGYDGILIGSAFAKATDPQAFLEDLLGSK